MARNFGQILVIAFVIVSAVYGKHSITTYMTTETQAKRLASITLRKLAQQPALNSYDPNLYPETWISIGQLRDDILREEFSANRRRQLWRRVQKKVEQNSNIRSTNRVGRSGEMSKAWEWIGAIGAISNSNTPSGAIADVDRSDAQLSTTRRGSGDAIRYTANWEESRPMF